MKRLFKFFILFLTLSALVSAFIFYVRAHSIAVLEPKGWVGEKERDLILTASELMLIVVIPVLMMTVFFSWYYRESNQKAKHAPDWEHNSIAEYCWWGIPFVIIVSLAVITWKSSFELSPFKPLKSEEKPLTIQVVALQWKWLFIYPEQQIATINFIQFPAHVPIHFEITADAPMNSFWIPELGGQIYAMPAMRSELNLIANKPGTFRGLSSNISGKGFAGMTFQAKASSKKEFHQWVDQVRSSRQQLDYKRYSALAAPTENNPVSYYNVKDKNLFRSILMKYLQPANP